MQKLNELRERGKALLFKRPTVPSYPLPSDPTIWWKLTVNSLPDEEPCVGGRREDYPFLVWHHRYPTPDDGKNNAHRSVVIYLHGHDVDLGAPQVKKDVHALGKALRCDVLAPEYPAYGPLVGHQEQLPGIEPTLDALQKTLQHYVTLTKSDRKLILVGRDLGGCLLLKFAQGKTPLMVAVENPFASLRDLIRQNFSDMGWTVNLCPELLDTVEAVNRLRVPLLVALSSDGNKKVSRSDGLLVFSAAATQVKSQVDLNSTVEFCDTAIKFFRAALQ